MEPVDPVMVPWRDTWGHALVVFVGLTLLYGLTAPLTVALEDDGEFVMAAYYLGVAHPPGYPLYVLLTHPFTWLPFGSVAYRVHLASGVFGAAAAATLWWVARTLGVRTAGAYAAAVGLGVSAVFWSQAVIAEVYTLNVLLFVSCLALGLAYAAVQQPAYLLGFAFALGLAASNHWPLMALATPCLLLTLWPAARALRQEFRYLAPRAALLFLLGLTPYLWMVLRSQATPELAFGGAIRTWDELMYYLNRSQYSQLDASVTAGMQDKLQYAGFLARESVSQFTPIGFLLASIGALVQWKRWGRVLSTALTLGFLTTLVALVVLLDLDFQTDFQGIVKVYTLVPFTVMAIWLGLGIHWIGDRIADVAPSAIARAAQVALGAGIIGLTVVSHWDRNHRRHYDFARDYGTTFLNAFAEDATVFTHGDVETFVMQYFHHVEGLRPDVTLLHDRGLGMAIDGRLYHHRVDPRALLTDEQRMVAMIRYARGAEGPVYFLGAAPAELSDTDYGFFKRVEPTETGETTFTVDDGLLAFFGRILARPDGEDEFTEFTKHVLIRSMTRILTGMVHLHPDPVYAERYGPVLEAATETLPGLLGRIGFLTGRGGATNEELLAWVEAAEARRSEAVMKSEIADLYLFKGRILRAMGRPRQAAQAFDASFAVFPHPSNPAREEARAVRTPAPGDRP